MEADALQLGGPFVPKCLDCGYDLTSLPDGVCPECGHAFTIERLRAADRARHERIGLLRKSALTVPLVGSLAVSCFGSGAQSYWLFGFLLFIVCAAGYLYFRLWYDVLLTQSEVLLVLLLPLFTLLIGISTNPSPWPGVALTIGVSAVVAWAALRWSPLMSAGIILWVVMLPMLGCGAVMVLDGVVKQAKGLHWSEFSWPAIPRWRALTAAEALPTGGAVIACGCVVGVMTVFYARRALVRLRRRGLFKKSPRGILEQLRTFLP